MSTTSKIRWQAFHDPEYRQAYAEGFSDSKIATQIKVLREQRGWTQQQLADAAGMKQSRIAALEDVNYSSWSLRTLRRLAQAFDVWLDVEFQEFGAIKAQLRHFSRKALGRRPFVEDPAFVETTEQQISGVTSAFTTGPIYVGTLNQSLSVEFFTSEITPAFTFSSALGMAAVPGIMSMSFGSIEVRKSTKNLWGLSLAHNKLL